MSAKIAQSVLDLIGRTPVLELNKVRAHFGFDGRILAKLEHLNPGASKKDRVALEMVQAAKAGGKLCPGQPVVEVTSGNTGTGLAIVCRALGHPFYAVMSRGNTRERAQMMRALGAEVVLVDQEPGAMEGKVSALDMKRVRQHAAQLIAELGAFYTDQFENPANSLAHENHTAVELWEQCDGRLDAIVAFVGSGGAMGGLVRGLRKFNPQIRAYVVEPSGAASLACCCCSDAAHGIQGGGYGRENLTLLRDIQIDGYFKCSDEDAATATRLLALHEGILAGYSTGAQLHAAIELLRGRESGKTLAMMVCDSGMKYFSTPLYP